MKWLSLLLAGLLSIISIPAGAADLYLIKIENQTALDAANRIVGSARGMVGDRFLVDLSADQAGQLSGAGISIEKIESSYTGGKLFLISPVSSNYVVEPKGISYLYTRDHLYLAELGEKEIGTLRDEGFQIVPIGDRTTPFFYHPPLVPAPSMAFYPSDTLADMVSQDSLYSYVHRLELFKTRYAYSDSISAARDWLMSRFAEFGYSTISLDPFIYNGHSLQNVVCLKAGTTEPTRYIVIGAHYDSYCQNADPYITAPGADDNGSGTGAVLELARILKDVPFKYSIIFAPFSAEEEGLIGSAHMASEMKSQGTDIDFMLNFDMISFTAGDADSVLIFNYPDYFRSNCFRDAAGRVTDVVPMQYNGANGSSDEYSFYQQGYRTVGFMEWDFNMANYHRTTDLTTNMDFPYYQKVVKIIAAALGVINNALPPVNLSMIWAMVILSVSLSGTILNLILIVSFTAPIPQLRPGDTPIRSISLPGNLNTILPA